MSPKKETIKHLNRNTRSKVPTFVGHFFWSFAPFRFQVLHLWHFPLWIGLVYARRGAVEGLRWFFCQGERLSVAGVRCQRWLVTTTKEPVYRPWKGLGSCFVSPRTRCRDAQIGFSTIPFWLQWLQPRGRRPGLLAPVLISWLAPVARGIGLVRVLMAALWPENGLAPCQYAAKSSSPFTTWSCSGEWLGSFTFGVPTARCM